jgi:hypothetical protein
VSLHKDSRELCSFITSKSKWKYTRLPIRLVSSSYTFQSLVDKVLLGVDPKAILAYLDDIAICHAKFEDHIKAIRDVLQRLTNANMTVKGSKCVFAAAQMPFLGHILTQEGI